MQDWVWVIQLLSAVGVAAAAFFAWQSSKAAGKSAAAADKSAEATENTVKAQIVMEITSTYSSSDMGESVKRLHDWKRQYPQDFAQLFEKGLREPNNITEQLDGDRRKVAHYFHPIRAMLDCGVVDEDFVRKLVKPDQVDILLDVVEPLVKAKDPNYDHSTFDTFRRIYNK